MNHQYNGWWHCNTTATWSGKCFNSYHKIRRLRSLTCNRNSPPNVEMAILSRGSCCNFCYAFQISQYENPDQFWIITTDVKWCSNQIMYPVCWSQFDPTGIIFRAAAIGIPRNPRKTLMNHCHRLRGVVFANAPRNSMMMIWKKTVQVSTATKT